MTGMGWGAAVREYAALTAVVLALVVAFGFATDHFFTAATFRTIANQIPAALVVAVGMTFVLVIAAIDLSVGSVLAVRGGARRLPGGPGPRPAPGRRRLLLTGLVCGALNGLVVVRWACPRSSSRWA